MTRLVEHVCQGGCGEWKPCLEVVTEIHRMPGPELSTAEYIPVCTDCYPAQRQHLQDLRDLQPNEFIFDLPLPDDPRFLREVIAR